MPKTAKLNTTLRISATTAPMLPKNINLIGGIRRRIHSPRTIPIKPKIATKKNACSGLMMMATIMPATVKLIKLHFKPWRIPQIIIGKGQTKFTKTPATGTYILIKAITMAIAAKMPASTMAEVLRNTLNFLLLLKTLISQCNYFYNSIFYIKLA